ncbi:unnamed protein product [Adineta ricciae]|uniref:Uncharacterized protein n=1 Tax=Adineta ricciae TaxID=249248 RepID=A0A814Z0W5_ADIRI|nr:unnamed protein product [Adineta ricciae]CAF1254903.1 unnamed protein product [Adineta ricciae]
MNYIITMRIIRDYYKQHCGIADNLTCYTHLKCYRGSALICLDWTEICDGKLDCLDGNADEEHCWQLEFNECQPNEYVCDIDQCIPYEFVRDDKQYIDCIDRSDEKAPRVKNLFEMYTAEPTLGSDDFRYTDAELFARLKHRYVPLTAIQNGKCDCGYIDESFCGDENEHETLVHTAILFPTICDDVQELRAIEIDEQNHTDETECQPWECDNIYTRCDGIWNCLDGRDEIECNFSPALFNCSSKYRICVTPGTFEFTYLPKHQLNDGKVDCLGGTDEPKLCEVDFQYFIRGGFYCTNNGTPNCLETYELCNQEKDCSFGDDEQFCLQNRSTLPHDGLCRPKDQLVTSNVDKFICNKNTNELFNEYKLISLLDNRRCLRGLDVRVWLNQPSNLYTSTCLCPPNYYGNQCQYQNQRVILAIQFHVSAQSRHTQFAILIRIVHSYE